LEPSDLTEPIPAAPNILNTGHSYGIIEDTLKILHVSGKGSHMNTLERFHVYNIAKRAS
jgi:hypothetical protein